MMEMVCLVREAKETGSLQSKKQAVPRGRLFHREENIMASDRRFIKVFSEGGGFKAGSQIWVDRETGVQYLWHADGYAGGLTVLVDAEGKPLLYRETREYSPEL